MRTFPYEKWEATGNDFVVVDLQQSPLALDDFTPDIAAAVCHREHGVGADGLVLLDYGAGGEQPSRVTIWNSDGSLAQMCGNALRCVALLKARHFQVDSGLALIGERLLQTKAEGPEQSSVSMGEVAPVGGLPVWSSLAALDEVMGGRGYLLSFGNPHYVVPFRELPEDWALRGERAQEVAHALLGTEGINCGFLCELPDESGVHRLRVYERGAGVTQSCGSGACAASAVLESQLGQAPPHRIELLGGVLQVGRGRQGFELSGPARKEFEGRWSLL